MQESITTQNTSTWSHSSGSHSRDMTDWGTGFEKTVCPAFWYFASMEPSVNLKQEEKKVVLAGRHGKGTRTEGVA